jgi:hypothetical protein
MLSVVLGEQVRLDSDLADLAGAAINGTVTLTVQRPDGTEDAGSVSTDATGSYYATYTPVAAGLHIYRWESSGAAVAAGEGRFEVRAEGSL